MRLVKPSVDWKKYISKNNLIVTQYLSHYGDDFLKQCVDRIKQAYLNKSKYIIFIEFKKVDIVSILYSDDYDLALSYLMSLCEHLEKYELCAEIHRIQNSQRRIITKRRTIKIK